MAFGDFSRAVEDDGCNCLMFESQAGSELHKACFQDRSGACRIYTSVHPQKMCFYINKYPLTHF